MLNGLYPVVIFQFYKKLPSTNDLAVDLRFPIDSKDETLFPQPPIPVYLNEKIFNIIIDGESKSVDFSTATDTKTDGSAPDVTQSAIQSSVEIMLEAKQDSIAVTMLSALIDLAFQKATSKEYSITWISGATTIFGAVLQSYSVEKVSGTDKVAIKISLSRGSKNPPKPEAPGLAPVEGTTAIIPGN